MLTDGHGTLEMEGKPDGSIERDLLDAGTSVCASIEKPWSHLVFLKRRNARVKAYL